jgi:hypothetical protein
MGEVGDPLLELGKDTKPLARLAELGCTDGECAAILGVPVSGLVPYEALLAKARGELQARVRRALLKAAEEQHQPEALATLVRMYLTVPTPARAERQGGGKRRNVASEAVRLATLAALRDGGARGLRATEWQQAVREGAGLSRMSFFRARRALVADGLATYIKRRYRLTPLGRRALRPRLARGAA